MLPVGPAPYQTLARSHARTLARSLTIRSQINELTRWLRAGERSHLGPGQREMMRKAAASRPT